MRQIDENIGRFAEAITDAMRQRGLDMYDLAKATGISYEHVRRLALTKAFPSKVLLAKICKTLHLDSAEMERLLVEDRIQTKYKTLPAEIYGRNPRFGPLERVATKLTDQQLDMLVNIAHGMAKSNRA